MTDRIIAYRDRWENEENELEKPTKEMACEWLDAQIEYHEKLDALQREYIFPLAFGKLLPDKGEFEHEVIHTVHGTDCVLWGYQPIMTVYKGIEILSDIIGEELKVCEHDASYPYNYWFRYGKYIIDQIEHYPIKGVDCEVEEWRK